LTILEKMKCGVDSNLNFPGAWVSLRICRWSDSSVLFEHHTWNYTNTVTVHY